MSISEPISSTLIKDNSAFVNKFNIIVASSVFSFIPNFESTLRLLKSLLVKNGIIIQWDWLSPENNSEFWLSESTINKAYKSAGLKQLSITQPFSISTEKGIIPVVMGVAKNA